MGATPGACIKPGCLARRPLCRKVNLPAGCEAQRLLCHKVNLPRCEALRHHFIMTCDIQFGNGQTNILALCYLFGKTWSAHSSATQTTEINTLDQITGKVIGVSRTHWFHWSFPWNVWNWEVYCSVSEPVFEHNHCALALTTKMWSWFVLSYHHLSNSLHVEFPILNKTSNSWHYSCPRSEYCRSIAFLLVV